MAPIFSNFRNRQQSFFEPCRHFRLFPIPIILFFLIVLIGHASAQDVEDIFPSIKTPPPPQEIPKEESLPKKEEPKKEEAPPPKTPVVDRLLSHLGSDLTWGGYVRNETAFRFVSPTGFDKILNILQLEGRYRILPKVQLSGRFRAFYDAVYDVESIDTISPIKGPNTILVDNVTTPDGVKQLDPNNVRNVEEVRSGVELKELYLDMNFK